jgi:hypothetical protein
MRMCLRARAMSLRVMVRMLDLANQRGQSGTMYDLYT